MSLSRALRSGNGVVTARGLQRAGVTRRQVDEALRSGRLVRLRKGWYASPRLPHAVVRAVAAGGALTCSSALALQGMWTMPDERLHVRIPRGSARPGAAGLRIHWSDRRLDDAFPIDSVREALRIMVDCADQRAVVVALDSALNLSMVTKAEAEDACASPRGRRLLSLADSASESGTETLTRLALRRLRLRVRTQVEIPGVGHVDLLVGDRLVVELDGEKWHDRPGDFERDRRRDRALVTLGYLVIRASYKQVMQEWPQIEAQILTIIRQGRHRWARQRT